MNNFEIGAKFESPCGQWRCSGRLKQCCIGSAVKPQSSSSRSPQVLLPGAPECDVLLFLELSNRAHPSKSLSTRKAYV